MNEFTVFQNVLSMQLRTHPSMQPQDVVKLCYQAAYGAEHLLTDLSGAERYFYEEYESVPATAEPLFEPISRDVYRANFGAWKTAGLPAQWLWRMFTGASFSTSGANRLKTYLVAAEQVLLSSGYPMEAWKVYLDDYKAQGMPPVRHSAEYREKEHPAYRIVSVQDALLMPVLKRVAAGDAPYVIAIDGMAGAGKSTFAGRLGHILGAGMVYMDDFFLPPALRTPERMAETGGNVHYERFAQEVLHHLHSADAFSYTRFDCSVMDYGQQREVAESPYRIVEGSYSHHPALGDYANLRVFMEIDAKTQMKRITRRNGKELAQRFKKEWIPMENHYFEAFDIARCADIVM